MGMFNRTDLMSLAIREDILRPEEVSCRGTPLHLRMSCACFAAPLPVCCRLVAALLPVSRFYVTINLPRGRFGFHLHGNGEPPLYDPLGLERYSICVTRQLTPRYS
jgi:hypothetical protein